MPVLVFSKGNLAGESMAEKLVALRGFEAQPELRSPDGKYAWKNWQQGSLRLVEIPTLHIFSDYLREYPVFNDADLLIFLSTHKSDTDSPALTTHTCGNFGAENRMGGNPRELARASSSALKIAFNFLASHPLAGFPAFLEATHHGPTSLKAPALFVETGSTEEGYRDEKAAERMVECVMEVCDKWRGGKKFSSADRVAIAFGGTHYCAKFSKLMLQQEYAFSYIFSKYGLNQATPEIISQAMEKSAEKVEVALIEKKSMNAEIRERIIGALKASGLEYELV